MASQTYIPNLNTFGDLIDRLIVEVNKLSYFENKKRQEQAKSIKDSDAIAFWDNLSRDACEYRSQLKNKINETLKTIIETKEYNVLSELRTFKSPKGSVEDLLAERCMILGENVFEQMTEQYGSLD